LSLRNAKDTQLKGPRGPNSVKNNNNKQQNKQQSTTKTTSADKQQMAIEHFVRYIL